MGLYLNLNRAMARKSGHIAQGISVSFGEINKNYLSNFLDNEADIKLAEHRSQSKRKTNVDRRRN